MIDFRYHLVSLVSVFLALAIGVVLGAGPLRDTIGATLEEQVESLREDRSNLQRAVANRDTAIEARDSFVEALGPDIVAGRLGGADVALVVLPEVEEDVVGALAERLGAAGARVTATARLLPAWTDPEAAAVREELVEGLAPPVPPADPSDEGPDAQERLGALLAAALLAPAGQSAPATGVPPAAPVDPGVTPVQPVQPVSASAAELREALVAADLVELEVAGEVDPGALASGVVVVAPPPPVSATAPPAGDGAAATGEGGGAGDAEQAAEDGASWVPLLTALRERAASAVLVGPAAAGEGVGLLATVRAGQDDSVDALVTLSTVDGVDGVVGQITTVLALREQLDGGSGSYGAATTAEDAAPPQDTAG